MLCIILSSQGSRAQKARGTNVKNDIMNVNFFGREGVTMITRHLVIARFSVTDKSSSALFSSLFWHFVTEKIRGPNLHVANLLIPTLLRLCPVTIYVCAWNFLRLCPSRHQNVAYCRHFFGAMRLARLCGAKNGRASKQPVCHLHGIKLFCKK